MPNEWSVQARWLFPVEGPPIEGGILVIAGDRIAAIERAGERKPDLDLGNVALLPGLVNAHTHLDLGQLRGQLPPPAHFTDWLRAVVAYRRRTSPSEWRQAIQGGIEECLRSGTTLVGDISSGGHSGPLLAASPLRATVFYELIGLGKARAKQTRREASAWLREQQATPSFPNSSLGTRPGLSPHAPYSVRHSLFRWAARQGLPLAIHLAETPLEEELLLMRRGPLRSFLEEVGAWEDDALAESLNWIVKLNQGSLATLYAHGNDLLDSVAPKDLKGATVVYCPRTHAYFGHPPYPFRELLQAGVNLALGTDSLASNPDLSVLKEMRFLRQQHPELPGPTLLGMGTLAGARALGWEEDAGSLTTGKCADWIAVPLKNEAFADPHGLLFDSEAAVSEVCIRGEWVVRAGKRTAPGDHG